MNHSYKLKEVAKIFLPIILLMICYLNFIGYFNTGLNIQDSQEFSNLQIPSSSHFSNQSLFWETEKLKVDNIELNSTNIWINTTTIDNSSGIPLNRTEISYKVPNWTSNSTLFSINATYFTPTNTSGDLQGPLPGVVLYHGIGASRGQNFGFARQIASFGCAVLVPDHPGHGDSGGPAPSTENLFYQGDFNNESHIYLIICAGLQGVRMLENLSRCSQIAVGGFSYGGLTSKIVGAIYSDKISLVLPHIHVGSSESTFPESATYFLMDVNPTEYQVWYETTKFEWDPVYYINKTDNPDIFWSIGTNDEFFYYMGINESYNSVPRNDGKWLQIKPNFHHIVRYDNTSLFLLNHSFFGGGAPPNITIINQQEIVTTFGDSYEIDIKIDTENTIEIESVEICYRYKDIIGEPWKTKTIILKNGETNIWEAVIEPGPFNSEVEYYIIVNIDWPGQVWFTSPFYSAGILNNNLALVSIIVVIALIGIPVFLMMKNTYNKDVINIKPDNKDDAKKIFIIKNILLIITESIFFTSLLFPWVIIGPNIGLTFIFFMNQYLTMAHINLAILCLAVWIINGLIAIKSPMISGILSFMFPLGGLVIINALMSSLGGSSFSTSIGIGLIMFSVAGILQTVFGIWKWRKYKEIIT